MNPLTLLQLLGPLLKQLPRQAREELLSAMKTGARTEGNAFRMIQRGSSDGTSAIRSPGAMFDRAGKANSRQTQILDLLTEDLGGDFDPSRVDDARDMLMNIMAKRPIHRRR